MAVILVLVVSLIGCKKRFDEGNNFSILSAKQRLSGTWKLDKLKVGEPSSSWNEPSSIQKIILTKNEISSDQYEARFESFEEEFCFSETGNDSLAYVPVTASGTWEFSGGPFGRSCQIDEELDSKEGIFFETKNAGALNFSRKWKIIQLTNNELG